MSKPIASKDFEVVNAKPLGGTGVIVYTAKGTK